MNGEWEWLPKAVSLKTWMAFFKKEEWQTYCQILEITILRNTYWSCYILEEAPAYRKLLKKNKLNSI